MSIRKRLLIWLLSTLFVASVIAGTTIYMKTLAEVDEMQDNALKQIAYSMQYSNRMNFSSAQKINDPDNENDEVGEQDNEDFEFIGQIWARDKALLLSTHPEKYLPLFDNGNGAATVAWKNQKWRIFSIPFKGGVIQVAQSFSAREETAAVIAERALIPFLALIPTLGILIWIGVSFGLRPLKRIASDLEERHADSMQPLGMQYLPAEMRSMVLALNALLKRLADSLELQRRFIADAAHELRTPLTALNLQAEIMSRSTDKSEVSDALSHLKQGITRSTRLVEQLLCFERYQTGVNQMTLDRVELGDLAKNVIGELAPVAESKNIDLGLTSTGKAYVLGDANSLRTMLVNLIDNSIRYIPEGEKIDIHIGAEGSNTVLEITDTGAGISPEDRERVFDRFYRGHVHHTIGSGLGLAIVKSIVDRHGANIVLGEGDNGVGLKARIVFRICSSSAASQSIAV